MWRLCYLNPQKTQKDLQVIKLLPNFAKTYYNDAYNFYHIWIQIPVLLQRSIHVHVIKGKSKAKYNIFPVELVDNQGFKPQELKLIESIIEENVEIIAQHWNMFFNNNK